MPSLAIKRSHQTKTLRKNYVATGLSSTITWGLGGDSIDDLIRHHMGFLQSIESGVKQFSWAASKPFAGFMGPSASEFCDRLWGGGYDPDSLINVVPTHKVIYVAVPKAASTQIKAILAQVAGKHSRSLKSSRRQKLRGPYGPRSMTAHSFFRLATDFSRHPKWGEPHD
jgi:hypothetical protein